MALESTAEHELRDPGQADEWKMVPATRAADGEIDASAWAPTDESVRSGARSVPRPSGTWLEARKSACGSAVEIHLVRGICGKNLVRPVGVVPAAPERQLMFHISATERDEHEPSRALALEGPDQPLHDRDAAVLTDRTKSVLDPPKPAPTFETLGGELDSLVRDEMTGHSPGGHDGTVEEGSHRLGGRLIGENGDSHDAPREVIDHDGNPPTEGPDLRQREGEPRHPEAERGWNRREIGVPDVVGRRAVTTRPETA